MKRKDIPKATPRKFHAGGGLTPMYGPRPIDGVTSAMPTPSVDPSRIRYARPVPASTGTSTGGLGYMQQMLANNQNANINSASGTAMGGVGTPAGGTATPRAPRRPRRTRRTATPTGTPRMARRPRRPRTPTAVRRNPFQR